MNIKPAGFNDKHYSSHNEEQALGQVVPEAVALWFREKPSNRFEGLLSARSLHSKGLCLASPEEKLQMELTFISRSQGKCRSKLKGF